MIPCSTCGGSGMRIAGFPDNIHYLRCPDCHPPGEKTAEHAFVEFLNAAGFKSANLGPTLGGATSETPANLVFLMRLTGDVNEYLLNCGDMKIRFAFDKEGAFLLAPLEAPERSAQQD